MKTLYLIRGVGGSGKSTFAKVLRDSGIVSVVLEADQYFVEAGTGKYNFDPKELGAAHEHCQKMAKVFLIEKDWSIAVSNTSTTEKEVEVYHKIAEESNAKFVSIIMENRHNGVNIHNVPENKLQQMKQRFSVKL
jgi:predicted ABC-type ATPase